MELVPRRVRVVEAGVREAVLQPLQPQDHAALRDLGAGAKSAVPALTAALKDRDLYVRRFAARALGEIGPDAQSAVPALNKALEGQPSAEVRRRVEGLLEKLKGSGASAERLRTARALEVLEQMDVPEAKQLLETLAKGEASAWLTQEAKAALGLQARRAAP